MDTIGVRELQQRASAVLRRVERGEVLGVTERGRLVAVLGPPSATGAGALALITAGRVRPARRPSRLPEPVPAASSIAEVLDDLRTDR